MNEEILEQIFTLCAAKWDISVEEVRREYRENKFTIEELPEDHQKFLISPVSRPEFVIHLDDS